MKIDEFIAKNKKYWCDYNIEGERKGDLLVECNTTAYILYLLALNALKICNAKNLYPVWLTDAKSYDVFEQLKSYDKCATRVYYPKLNSLDKIKISCQALIIFKKIRNSKDLLSFKYDGVKYGDIIYDTYLTENQVSTLKVIDKKVYKLIRSCLKRHTLLMKLYKQNHYSAVLVSHRIGMDSGIIYRTAMKCGIPVYSLAIHSGRLTIKRSVTKVVDYELTPSVGEISELLELDDREFEKAYDWVYKNHILGNTVFTGKDAFSDDYRFIKEREVFSNRYGLDQAKKNIFVMIHAFTDYPNGHFSKMLFNDYGDWFAKTLEFAKQDDSVNWIFKRHPSDYMYPVVDVDFKELFSNSPRNIIFLDRSEKLDTRSLVYIADAVITCVGSAGIELPAFGRVPSILAAESHYSGLGFTCEPRTKEEYFHVLSRLSEVNEISLEKQKIAKATFIFIFALSGAKDSTDIEYFKTISKKIIDEKFYDDVYDVLEKNKDDIHDEFMKVIETINKESFYVLRRGIAEFLVEIDRNV